MKSEQPPQQEESQPLNSAERPALSEKQKKEAIWQDKIKKVRELKDKIGGEMDPGIVDTVAAFWLHGISTSQSCEGHLDSGYSVPSIQVEAPGRPKNEYENNEEYKRWTSKI